jgi:hypothetical protein
MGLMPQSLVGKIQFCESHLADWQTNAVAIGSSAAEITALTAKTDAARAALTAQETAQETAKTKTAALRDAVKAMADATADVVKKIRAKAATDGNGIYQLANIPAPATPSPIGAPGMPTDLVVKLNPNGSLDLGWSCSHPAGSTGVIYHVFRQLGAEGEFTFIGGSGAKKFADGSVPAGTAMVVYQIQAIRSSAIGVANEFIVRFGTGGAGAGIASVTQAAPKMAA